MARLCLLAGLALCLVAANAQEQPPAEPPMEQQQQEQQPGQVQYATGPLPQGCQQMAQWGPMAIFCGSLQCPNQPFDLHCMCRTGTPMTAQQPGMEQPEQPEGRRRRLLQETQPGMEQQQPGMEQQQPEMQCQEVACLAVGHNAQDQQDTQNAVWWTCPVEQGTVNCMQAQPQVEQIDPCLWTNVQEIAGVWQPQLVQGLSIAQPQDQQQQQPPAGQMMEQPGEPVGVQAGP